MVLWLWFWVVEQSRRGVVMWCGFCGCHFAVFNFDFLHSGRHRLPPIAVKSHLPGMQRTLGSHDHLASPPSGPTRFSIQARSFHYLQQMTRTRRFASFLMAQNPKGTALVNIHASGSIIGSYFFPPPEYMSLYAARCGTLRGQLRT